ncbi:MAG: hypothetical protein JKX70_07730 [Phycisphaerales bacterium]|nr:hypothetical protein [Phycisphaerales bacterium]
MNLENNTFIEFGDPNIVIQQQFGGPFDLVLTPETGFDGQALRSFGGNITNLSQDQFAHSLNTTVLNTSAAGFDYTSTANAESMLGSGNLNSIELGTSIDLLMTFSVDTVLDIFLRIDFQDINNADIFAEFEVDGLQGVPAGRIEIENPTSDGFIELTLQATVLAGGTFTLSSGGFLGLPPLDHDETLSSGDLVMTAIVRVVPAPGGLVVFGGLGILTVRRRR